MILSLMLSTVSLEAARSILGADVLGVHEVASVFGADVGLSPIPYSAADLEVAATAGECLILRLDRDEAGPLTLLRLIERFPRDFDQRLLRTAGYLLKDDWGIQLEPLAATDTCAAGWTLVRKAILNETRNLPYEEQESALGQYAATLGIPRPCLRRRSAVEIAYDLILYQHARGERLLASTWDWSASRTVDSGYLNVGGFGRDGMQILSYSPAVRHGALGVCPVRRPLV